MFEVKDEGRDSGEKNAALLLETLLCFSRFQMHYISKTSEDFFLQD